MTSGSSWLPRPAATPPMITVVSLGTIGTTESKKAMARMTSRNHQWPEMSLEPIGEIGDDPRHQNARHRARG